MYLSKVTKYLYFVTFHHMQYKVLNIYKYPFVLCKSIYNCEDYSNYVNNAKIDFGGK